jgi:hypothetical protein
MARKKILCTGPLVDQLRQNKNLLYQHNKPDKPAKEGPLSFVLFEPPFTSVPTVSWGYPTLVSLVVRVADSISKTADLYRPFRSLTGMAGAVEFRLGRKRDTYLQYC